MGQGHLLCLLLVLKVSGELHCGPSHCAFEVGPGILVAKCDAGGSQCCSLSSILCLESLSDLLFLASLSITVFCAPGGSFPPPMLFVNTAG